MENYIIVDYTVIILITQLFSNSKTRKENPWVFIGALIPIMLLFFSSFNQETFFSQLINKIDSKSIKSCIFLICFGYTTGHTISSLVKIVTYLRNKRKNKGKQFLVKGENIYHNGTFIAFIEDEAIDTFKEVLGRDYILQTDSISGHITQTQTNFVVLYDYSEVIVNGIKIGDYIKMKNRQNKLNQLV